MGMIVTGYIDAPEERAEEIATAFEAHAELSRQEPGCELFELTRDAEIPGRFHVRERYRDGAAFEAHKARAAAADWMTVSAGLPRTLEFGED